MRGPNAMNRAAVICVLCVHRLPASARRFLLGLHRRKPGNADRGWTRLQSVQVSTLTRPMAHHLSPILPYRADGQALAPRLSQIHSTPNERVYTASWWLAAFRRW
jgi:hypothetical protein